MTQGRRPLGIILLVAFFAAGAVLCIVVMLAIAFPRGALEIVWRCKPEVRDAFQEFGTWSILLVAGVGAGCGLSAFGLARGAEWGRHLAICVLTVNVVGDTFIAVFRQDRLTAIGLPIGALMIWYLAKKKPVTNFSA